jgi:hypothetical protein
MVDFFFGLFGFLEIFPGVWRAIGGLFNWDDPLPDKRWTDDPDEPSVEPEMAGESAE